MGHRKASATRIAAVEKRLKALELRKRDLTYVQIGRALGVSDNRAYALVISELDKVNQTRTELAEQVRRLELERLDRMLAALDLRIAEGEPVTINVALNIMARRAKLVRLDPAEKVEVSSSFQALIDEWEQLRDHPGPLPSRPSYDAEGEMAELAPEGGVRRPPPLRPLPSDDEPDFSILVQGNFVGEDEYDESDK